MPSSKDCSTRRTITSSYATVSFTAATAAWPVRCLRVAQVGQGEGTAGKQGKVEYDRDRLLALVRAGDGAADILDGIEE